MKIKCLIVDNEPLAIQLIENHISQLENFEVTGTSPNAVRALEIIRTTPVDLMFLDIKMPLISGLDFLRGLKSPPAVIITTAHREYAVQGYELDLVDYLLKPITFERFFKAIDRYMRSINTIGGGSSAGAAAPYPPVIYWKARGKFAKFVLDDILYIESLKDCVVVYCKDGKTTVRHTITDLEAQLEGKSFLRIHRSFIINTKNVTAFNSNDVEFGKIEIPIGPSYKELVAKVLSGGSLGKV